MLSFKSKIGNVYCPLYVLELLTSVYPPLVGNRRHSNKKPPPHIKLPLKQKYSIKLPLKYNLLGHLSHFETTPCFGKSTIFNIKCIRVSKYEHTFLINQHS